MAVVPIQGPHGRIDEGGGVGHGRGGSGGGTGHDSASDELDEADEAYVRVRSQIQPRDGAALPLQDVFAEMIEFNRGPVRCLA